MVSAEEHAQVLAEELEVLESIYTEELESAYRSMELTPQRSHQSSSASGSSPKTTKREKFVRVHTPLPC